jgi:phosphate transport system protein
MIEEKINELKQRLTEYATHIEMMIEKSVDGLLKKDGGILKKVMNEDETRANNLEIELDDLCTTIIAQFQPKAKMLRTVLMILKMNNDLERMGDLAANICDSAVYLIDEPPVKPLIDIPVMADSTKSMIKDSITAFINENADLAKDVCKRDEEVDNLRNKILRELIAYMNKDTSIVERALHLMRITRNLERMADLSTNMCEDIIFMVKGQVIKHHRS